MIRTLYRHYLQEIGFVPAVLDSTALAGVHPNPHQPFDAAADFSYLVQPRQQFFCGHNIMESAEFPVLSGGDLQVPVSPLFARDLAGRAIHLGLGPEQKRSVQWQAYAAAPLPGFEAAAAELLKASVTFPAGCRSTVGMAGADELETVFLTRFRNLEIAMAPGTPASGNTDNEVGVYERANLYPYKLRPDTFYTDGYKLPQTSMLFARGEDEGVSAAAAQKLGEAILEKWKQRDSSKTWGKFTEDQGGDTWIEDLFAKGCTLIPTFEACNGYHVVGEQFELTDYWPGRAVLGLHQVESAKPSKSPVGTILEVLQPGFVTAKTIQPALVVISDGSGYLSPNQANPAPLLPNLHLPHGRSIAQWNTCWLPTHPGHFEAPALWGWDILDTGRFVQLSGPLWDPLHYYYASADEIIAAHNKPVGQAVPVPAHMQNRFYPMAVPDGFDTFSQAELQRRTQNNLYPRTAIVRQGTGKPGCNFGYHPLPLEYEYELEPFWMPDQHPLNRIAELCPEALLPLLAPVIMAPIGSETYRKSLQVPEAATWFGSDALLGDMNLDPVQSYPQLMRYVMPDLAPNDWLPLFPAPYLASPRPELLSDTPQQLWQDMDSPDDLQAVDPGMADALDDAKEESLALMRYRHRVYRGKKLLYTLAWWYGLNTDELTSLDSQGAALAAQQTARTDTRGNSRVGQVARAAAQGAPAEQPRRRAAQQAATPIVREG